ncbi:unnamed protein product [Hydatigera taeniaeformis]|uniref:EGF-like domain-containing protein n=1 Tax=Hydatigena taeniaeformis TaxID=6205 RepID=A0A0R3WQS9_HYDTA|nr:unnamed protein product [Hydatigera taeniaeformis]
MIVCLLPCVFFFGLTASAKNCDLCRTVLEKYRSAFHEINSDISLGGGNTDWEEKFIGKYAFSELHAFETLEQTLKSLNDREAQFLSEIEGEIENFWTGYLKTGLSNLDSIVDDFCIERLRLCCPWNKFGRECLDCDSCTFGNGMACISCHPSCAGGCSDTTSSSCVSCAKDGETICEDIDEFGTFCVNSEGSFSCVKCPDGCITCINSSTCLSCSSGYALRDAKCIDIDECYSPDACPGFKQRCINKPGSYLCACEEGYRLKEGVCVPAASRSPNRRRSGNRWNSKQSTKLLAEFSKLIVILVFFGVVLYLNSSRLFVCAPLAAATIGIICYQAAVLDNLHTYS